MIVLLAFIILLVSALLWLALQWPPEDPPIVRYPDLPNFVAPEDTPKYVPPQEVAEWYDSHLRRGEISRNQQDKQQGSPKFGVLSHV